MKSIRFAFGLLLLLVFFAGASQAQVQRTFVSRLGSDGNPCSFTAPCRTFGTAIGQTNAGGEVYVLDTAGYGSFVVTKSITINAPQGVIAGISVFSGDGTDINAGVNDTVILRGLTVNSQGGQNGISFNTGVRLHIENSVVSGFGNGAGIQHISAGNLLVRDTTARGNESGILILGSGHASMEQVRLDGNTVGLNVLAGIAAIRNSSMSANTFTGATADGLDGDLALLDIDTCLITDNGAGIDVESPTSFMSISNCTISHNPREGFLVSVVGGTIFSRGNNTIIGNGPNLGSLTPLTAQ